MYAVQFRNIGMRALVDIRGAAGDVGGWLSGTFDALPERPNTARTRDGLSVCWLGREQWLLCASIECEERLATVARVHEAPVDLGVVLVSDSLRFFAVDGEDASQIVAIASPLDTRPERFPDNGVTFTEAFGIRTLLARTGTGFELGVAASFADMFQDCLQRSIA